MPLVLTSPTAQPALTTIDLQSVTLDFANGTVTVNVALKDSNGNILEALSFTPPPAVTASWLNGNKNAIYTHLQARYGAGTVT